MPTSEKTELMRSVNSGIALFVTDMPTTASSEKWVFVCECGAPECAAWLELDLAAYDAMRADAGGEILAAGHVASSPAQRARRECGQPLPFRIGASGDRVRVSEQRQATGVDGSAVR